MFRGVRFAGHLVCATSMGCISQLGLTCSCWEETTNMSVALMEKIVTTSSVGAWASMRTRGLGESSIWAAQTCSDVQRGFTLFMQ